MSKQYGYLLPAACLLAASSFIGVLSAGVESDGPTKWQYNTTQISLDELPQTLTDMGNDGWEVFSIQDTRSVVESDPATNVPHVRTETFQVSAKRPAS
jgi:hypothetical protein